MSKDPVKQRSESHISWKYFLFFAFFSSNRMKMLKVYMLHLSPHQGYPTHTISNKNTPNFYSLGSLSSGSDVAYSTV